MVQNNAREPINTASNLGRSERELHVYPTRSCHRQFPRTWCNPQPTRRGRTWLSQTSECSSRAERKVSVSVNSIKNTDDNITKGSGLWLTFTRICDD